MAACRWKGVIRRGAGQPAQWTSHLSACPPTWRPATRHLVVTAAADGREAAPIGPDDDDGRTWYAETA